MVRDMEAPDIRPIFRQQRETTNQLGFADYFVAVAAIGSITEVEPRHCTSPAGAGQRFEEQIATRQAWSVGVESDDAMLIGYEQCRYGGDAVLRASLGKQRFVAESRERLYRRKVLSKDQVGAMLGFMPL